jgi:N-acetylglucosamine-6-phosphate deacetylase
VSPGPLVTKSGNRTLAGRLVLEDRVDAGRIHVAEGRIQAIDLDDGPVDGPLIGPGLVDIHVHGWGGHDAMDGLRALDGMARSLLRQGVTGFLPTAVTSPIDVLERFANDVRAWSSEPPADGARPLGFNLEGPFISSAKKGAQNPAFILEPARADQARLSGLLDGLRVITIAPELTGALDLIGWFADHGVVVSLGHSSATAEQAALGYAAGARSTTHLFNAMSGVDQHAPGLAVAALTHDAAYVELVADGFHVDPAVWPIILRTKPADRLMLVSDAISLAGTGDGRSTLGGLEVEVHDGQCRLVSNGALAGSVIAVDTGVRQLVAAGVPLPRAMGAASYQPLELLGIEDRGRIAVGQRADLVELDDDLRVIRVMLEGNWAVP